ncbi:MAG: AcrB/AcrD/AcrF family protein [Limimaricola sp.]|uniref:efflux RND transporter permease subunit n=1 Tax=Limimaricola sp. TaxID=2211665 RepID=UPI001DF2DB67|nr:efflux RND transporter permease subunit [Limimaricola sp.]MBI1418945.1 AcrB/AcrD/AcrF family protein [Limimaricola sp.]
MAENKNSQQGALLAALFVRRPVLAFVLNAIIFVAGIAAILGMQVQELPNVSRPVLTINTQFPGAAAETVDTEITSVIEGAIAGVNGVSGVSSSSSYGRGRTTVEFSGSTDINIAASDVRDAISRVANSLPADAKTPTVVKADSNAQGVMWLSVTSDKLSIGPLTDLVNATILDPLLAVDGVADVQLAGDAAQILTVDIRPDALAARGLTLADVSKALAKISFDVPAGTLNATNQNIIVRASASITDLGQAMGLQVKDGVKLSDVASVYLAPNSSGTRINAEGKAGVGLSIIGQAQSNTIAISNGIHAAIAALAPSLPPDVKITVNSDDAVFIRGAVSEVIRSMVISILVVTAIIFVFLRDWRATLIPAVSMPIALAGALAGIYLSGFSINILTLLALVLATGLVVDDAIVVLENIVRQRSLGLGPRAAAVLGTQEVYFAVLATTVTLAAVFIPISFLPGQVGGLFREFGLTLAMAVLVSSVVALSLTPMMAARAVAHGGHEAGRKPSLIARFGMMLARFYARTLHGALNAPLAVLAAAALFAAIAWFAFPTIRTELTPPEDRSRIAVIVQAPQNVSLDYTNAQISRIEELLAPIKASGEISNVFSITGFGGSTNRGFMLVSLVPEDQRSRSQQAIAGQINGLISQVPGVRAFAISPNSLRIRGGGNGLQFALVGTNYDVLGQAAAASVKALQADPRFGNVRSSYDTTQAQVQVQIDRARADQLGIDITGVGASLQAMLDGQSIGNVNFNDTTYPIYLQSTSQPINDPTDLENIFARTGDGRFVPMSSIVSISESAAAPSLSRESQRRAVDITAGLSDGFPIGNAYEAARALLLPELPPGVSIVPLAEAATIGQNANGLAVTFGFAALVILLVLAAQFESFVSAGIIMVTVPFGLAAAVFALILTGGTLNVYSQIGLVLLVGIMAKNGILVVEFANQLRDQGLAVREAIEQASAIRLRPIMMTKLATILGALPLVLATGPGAEARSALGWVIVGALGFAAVSTLYLTPATYLIFARLSKPRAHEEVLLQKELTRAAAIKAEGTPAQ